MRLVTLALIRNKSVISASDKEAPVPAGAYTIYYTLPRADNRRARIHTTPISFIFHGS